MYIALSKCKAASGALGCAPSINGAPIPYVQLVKILGVLFTDDLGWRLQAKSARIRMSRKLFVLRRIGSSLNIRSRAHAYKTCIKPHLEYCAPVWACCGGEQTAVDRVLERTNRIITSRRNDLMSPMTLIALVSPHLLTWRLYQIRHNIFTLLACLTITI